MKLRLGVAVAAVAAVTATGAVGAGATTTTFASTEGFSTSPSASTASGRCSRATANQLVDQHHLNGFLLPKPVVQLLCGPFTGAGSEAMAVTIGPAPTCWPIQNWAVFSFRGGAWQLVLDQPAYLFPPLVAVGSDIRETTAVHRPGDGRCTPSGGSHARTWHWNGRRFVAGPWKQVTPGAAVKHAIFNASFRGGGAQCWLGDDPNVRAAPSVHCSARGPVYSTVDMGLDGRLTICRSKGYGCNVGNSGEDPIPMLGYGKQITVGRFRCRSQPSGVICTVIRSGKGFLINSKGVSRVGQ